MDQITLILSLQQTIGFNELKFDISVKLNLHNIL